MPTTKVATKGLGATAKGKKAVKGNARPKRVTRKASDEAEYEHSAGGEDDQEENGSSSDSNDADMELFRAAFASVKSKNTKKKNAEFLKKNQALIDAAREKAEAMKLAGEAHLEQLVQQFEAITQPPQKQDIVIFGATVGERTKATDELLETSTLSLEQITADYEEAIQAADEEFQWRAARREKVRRHTIRQAHQILERGVEEQKLITDATDFIKNFQRLMSL